ncbi:MAG: cytochrome C biogenesis protein ResC [Geobacteraceae bacterium GWC2_53_11]|nr:MAG: cytochrome C biogenesis protein ResC [Geobacteraceae bacterium GWC2_53_11]
MQMMSLLHFLPWLSVAFLTAGCLWRTGLALGLAAQLIYLFSRALMLGRLPLLGPHDTLLFFSMSLALMGLLSSYTPAVRGRRWFTVSVGVTTAIFTLIALRFKPLNMPLPQILDTLWFELHVVVAFFGYALFTVGAIASAAYLRTGVRAHLDLLYKTALVGWTFFSASMISGGIWGYYAWGTYWLWTPKELWTSILWLFYALLLHVRLKGASWDTVTAWLGIAGAAVMLFTYLGVSMLMKSSHSF